MPDHHLRDPRQRPAPAPHRARGHARGHHPRRLRRRRPHRAPRGERDGPLPRAPRLQGRREVRRLPQGQRDGRAHGRLAQRLHVATTSSPSTSPCAPRRRWRRSTCSPTSSGARRSTPDELDRERGVVIQEIQRYKDQPSAVAEELIDRAAFGDHPLGRTGARARGAPAHLHAATRSSPSASAAGRARAAARSSSATSTTSPANGAVAELFERFPTLPGARALRAGAARCAPTMLVEQRDTNQSHLRMIYRPDVDVTDPRAARRADDLLDAAGRLDGLAPVRRDPRAARPLLLGLRRRPRVRRRCRSCSSAPAWSPPSASRPTRACARSSPSCTPTGPTEEEVERARAYAAGRRVLAFENTNAVARYAATQTIVFGEDIDPDDAIAALDAVTFDEVAEIARAGRPGDARRRLRRPARRAEFELTLLPPCGDHARWWPTAVEPRASSRATCGASATAGRSSARCSAARASTTRAAPAPQRERGPEYVVVLVSERFDGVPWLERVYQAAQPVGRRRDGRAGRRALLHARPSSSASASVAPRRVPHERRRAERPRRCLATSPATDAAQPIATMRSIGMRARSAISAGTLTSPRQVAQAVAQLRQRDHLHVAAARRLVGGDEVDVGRGHAQRVQHPGLGRDDRRAAAGPAWSCA